MKGEGRGVVFFVWMDEWLGGVLLMLKMGDDSFWAFFGGGFGLWIAD